MGFQDQIDRHNAAEARRLAAEKAANAKPRISAWAAVIALLGTASAFLAGVDWNVLFSQEGAAVAGATVGVAGAVVVLVRAVAVYVEKKRNG